MSTIVRSHSCSDTTPIHESMPFLISISLLFLLLVTLVHPVDKEKVAEGTVMEREIIHGNPLRKDEVAVSVNRLIGYNVIHHREYDYEIEAIISTVLYIYTNRAVFIIT